MTSIAGDGRIDPELLTNSAGTLPRGVAARIYLDTGLVEAGLPSRDEYRDDVFEFAANANRRALRQALTDTLRWSLEKRATPWSSRSPRYRVDPSADSSSSRVKHSIGSSSETCPFTTQAPATST